jgi:hypothetical protein
MPSFTTNAFATPFGKNVYLRSTRGLKFKSYMLAGETVPARTIDGNPNQRVLQPGTVLAKITSGANAGKVGPFQAAGSAANEVQTLTGGVGITAGTYKISLFNGDAITAAIAYNAAAAAVQTAVRAALAASANIEANVYADSITVTGGPANTATALTITYVGVDGQDVPQATADSSGLTGGTISAATTTAGVAGANDGRQTLANIVGINDTFLPWQTEYRDVEVAVLYDGAVVQANCIELDATGAEIALTDTTAAQMFGKKALNITFHTASTEI